MQAQAAAAADQQRLGELEREVDAKAAADADTLRRLQAALAAQQEELQR
jgi:hypothetical protein